MTPSELQSIKNRFEIIGNSSPLMHAIQVAVQVAPTDLTVLITGESGSGKESFSKIIHNLSSRAKGQFIAINCGAIPEGTIDSELFGHEKGAFTGALDARKGYFEVTDGGTIFLDEIGEMPLGTQARLLRVLENGEFIKVGSSKVQKTNVRVVTATNVNLLEAVERKKFREDLYYRLNTVPITVPALRERGQDIELLFRKFTADFAEKYHTQPIKLKDDAKQLLLTYRWPGNIRQLKNVAEQISVMELEREVDLATLSKYLPKEPQSTGIMRFGEFGTGDSISERDLLYKVLFDMKKDMHELKSMILESVNGGGIGADVLAQHASLFAGMNDTASLTVVSKPTEPAIPRFEPGPTTNVIQPTVIPVPNSENTRFDEDEYTEVHEEVGENLSLDMKEKELIEKALRKNKHKRKYAARDLGISERTLYRKIKQYQLESL